MTEPDGMGRGIPLHREVLGAARPRFQSLLGGDTFPEPGGGPTSQTEGLSSRAGGSGRGAQLTGLGSTYHVSSWGASHPQNRQMSDPWAWAARPQQVAIQFPRRQLRDPQQLCLSLPPPLPSTK